MSRLHFATTNEGKLKEAREILGIKVVGIPLEIDEIQSLDPVEVAVKKARSYFQATKKPVFIEDNSLTINALNGLPGPYIDAFMKTLGNQGILTLLRGVKNRRTVAQATIVYKSKRVGEEIFIGKTEGSISEKVRGEGFGWDPIFIPKGATKTFGEMTMSEKNKYSMRAKALEKLRKRLYDNLNDS